MRCQHNRINNFLLVLLLLVRVHLEVYYILRVPLAWRESSQNCEPIALAGLTWTWQRCNRWCIDDELILLMNGGWSPSQSIALAVCWCFRAFRYQRWQCGAHWHPLPWIIASEQVVSRTRMSTCRVTSKSISSTRLCRLTRCHNVVVFLEHGFYHYLSSKSLNSSNTSSYPRISACK